MNSHFIPLHTRLFPKNRGAAAYRPGGIAARCDWIVLSDHAAPQIHVLKQSEGPPRRIFLSLRAPFIALRHFALNILPTLTHPFVLITGSEDITLPDQTDARWRDYSAEERALMRDIHDHPLLRRWFAENLSRSDWPRMRPLPLGIVFAAGMPEGGIPIPKTIQPLADRPLNVMCAHRLREGPQWETRRTVTRIAREHWRGWVDIFEQEQTEPEFMAAMARHSFVLCVEGGGLDPSPKAWQALLVGTIPIIRSSALDAAYGTLPVVIVEDWTPKALSPLLLAGWRARLGPQLALPENRHALIARLGLDHWWDMIAAA